MYGDELAIRSFLRVTTHGLLFRTDRNFDARASNSLYRERPKAFREPSFIVQTHLSVEQRTYLA